MGDSLCEASTATECSEGCSHASWQSLEETGDNSLLWLRELQNSEFGGAAPDDSGAAPDDSGGPAIQTRRRWGSIRHLIRRTASSVGGDPENSLRAIQRGTLGDVVAQRQAAEILKNTGETSPHKLMQGLSELPWVEMLIDFASSDDIPTQRLVSSTVLSLAQHEENRLNLVEAGLLQPLMYLRTNCTDSTTRIVATEALDKLGVYSHLSLLQLVNIQGLAPLRYLGGCGDVRAQRTAASVLASLLGYDEARLDIVRGDGFRTVLSLATSGDEYIQTIASIAVGRLPIGSMDCLRIVEEGSLPGVVALINSPKPEFRAFATTVICNAISLESFHCEDCSLYPITIHRFCVSNACGNINLCQQCARLRGSAAMSQMQQIPVVTSLRDRVVTDGGHTALIGLIEAGNRQMSMDRSDVTAGTDRSDGTNSTALQSLAVRALASLAIKSSHAAEINRQGGLPMLVDLLIHFHFLKDNALVVLRNAVRALANMACCARQGSWQGEAIGSSILAARALQPLLVLTLHQDVEVVRHTARILAELATICVSPDNGSSRPESSPKGEAEGAESTGSRAVLTPFSDYRTGGTGSSNSNSSTFSPHRSSRSLSSTMTRSSETAMQPQIILECDGVEWLCILSSHEDWVVKSCAALIFQRISAAAHAWLANRAAGIIPAVISLAEEENPTTRHHAKFALAALSKYEVFQSRIIMQGDLRYLMVGRDEMSIGETRLTSVILRHLSASDSCRRALLHQDESGFSALDEVLRLVQLNDPEITANLAYVVSDMTLEEETMQYLANREVITMVMDWAMSDDETMQTNAAVTLANLASYQPTKALMGNLGAVPVLINLAASHNEEITRYAVEAMGHLSKAGPLDMPKSPRESAGNTVVRLVFGQRAYLLELASDLQYDRLLDQIYSDVELPERTERSALVVSYLDSEKRVMKVRNQHELSNVVRFHVCDASSATLTLHLALISSGVSVAAADDSGSFCKPIDSFVEINEAQLEFRERVGVGACGEVFHGKWRGVDVAIKCLFTDDGRAKRSGENNAAVDKELLQDFRNEVSLMMQLRHPNICLFMGAVIRLEKSRLCIVSEFCHRGSLYRIIHKSERELSWVRRVNLALDAARGCQFLHTHTPCIVHRDLKSPNLLVDRHWNVKVGDFGLARTKSHFYVSLGGGNVGTPEWTAPEVLKDEEYSEKADVYSFGVVLWELCTRKRPFKGLTQMQVVVAVGFNGERLPRVEGAGIDPQLSDLMQECMADAWHERPSFAEIVCRLEKIGVRRSSQQMARSEKGKEIKTNNAPRQTLPAH